MADSYSVLLFNETKNCILFLIAMLATSGIAYFKGFYKLEPEEKINISISYFSFVFFVFLFINLAIGPAIAKILIQYIRKNNAVAFTVLMNFFLNILTLFVLYIYCFKKRSTITLRIIKKKSSPARSIPYDIFIGTISWILAFPIVSFISCILNIFIITVFKIQSLPNQLAIDFIKSTMSHPLHFGLVIFMIVCVAPVLEEFLFRGVLQNFLKRYLNRKISIIITGIIFSFFHFSISQKLSNITIIGSLFAFACFLSFLYEKQNSLVSPIFLHATFNLISIINLLFIKGI